MGKSKLLLFTLLSLSICDDNIWPVCPGEGGEKCNKILLKNNIYSDQGPVPDVGITLPRGGNSRKHIFIQIIKNTFICFDPNLTASEENLFLKKVRP